MAYLPLRNISMPIKTWFGFNTGALSRAMSFGYWSNRSSASNEHNTVTNSNKPVVQLVRNYTFLSNAIAIPVVNYEQVKDLPNHPEITLIDVREPKELQETGSIPTSINIPCKLLGKYSYIQIQFY